MPTTNLVELRGEYETAKRWTIYALDVTDTTDAEDVARLKRFIERERTAAQAMISGVQRWNEERIDASLRNLIADLPSREQQSDPWAGCKGFQS